MLLGDAELSLQEQLESGLVDFDSGFEPLRVMTPTAKWLASSATQKAIRRGDAETAMRFAVALHKFHREYWWRRLPLVALEDVGHANRIAVAMTLWAARHARWRREHGDDRVLAFLVRELASGTKCRAAADLLFAPRTRAAAYRYRYQELPPGDWEPSPLVQWIEQAGQRVHAGMAGAFAALAPLADGPTTVEADELVDLGKIGIWPSWCIDIYTGDGRRALAYFLRACAPVSRLFFEVGVPPNKWSETLGGLVFRIEGQLCDRRLRFPGSMQAQQEATLGGARAPLGGRVEEALAVVREHLPLLHHARCRVLGGPSPRSPQTPPAEPDSSASQGEGNKRTRPTPSSSPIRSIKGQRNDPGIAAKASPPENGSEPASCASACAEESPMQRIALYSRVSTLDQHPEAQFSQLRAYAGRRGLEAIEYVDAGISGRRRSRPAFDRMMAAVRRRELGVIAVARLDRLARSLAHMAQLGEELRDLGVELVSLHESLDTSSAMGRAMFGMCGVFAQLEADIIKERTVAGLAAARRRGRFPGRPRKLDPESLARARRLRESGRSVREIAAMLEVGKSTVARELTRNS